MNRRLIVAAWVLPAMELVGRRMAEAGCHNVGAAGEWAEAGRRAAALLPAGCA